MPRKKPAKKPAHQPRKEAYTPARLKQIDQRVAAALDRLRSLLADMTEAQIASILADGHAMLGRGLRSLEAFIDHVARALREAKHSRS